MKTNKLIITFAILFLFASISFISAEEITEEEKPLILPGNPIYGIKTAMENVRMAFTFGDESKAEYGLELAQRRLQEVKFLDDEELINKTLQRRDRVMEQVRKRAEGINDGIQERINEQTQNFNNVKNKLKGNGIEIEIAI